MTNITKKGGKAQSFNAAKLRKSITKAAKDAKLSPVKTKQLAEDITEPVIKLFKTKKPLRTTQLRRSILGRLDRKYKSVARAWRIFEKKKK